MRNRHLPSVSDVADLAQDHHCLQLCASRHAANKAGTQCRLLPRCHLTLWLMRNSRMLRHPAPSTSLVWAKGGQNRSNAASPDHFAVVCQPWRHTDRPPPRSGTGEGCGIAVTTPYLAPAFLDAVYPASPQHSAQKLPSVGTRLCVVLLYLHVVLSPLQLPVYPEQVVALAPALQALRSAPGT
jgi:hypothetical protein